MSFQEASSRAVFYARRHGVRASLGRVMLAAKRLVSGNGLILYSCELAKLRLPLDDEIAGIQLHRKRGLAEFSAKELPELAEALNSVAADRIINERFARGASAWLVKIEDRLVAFGWTLIGATIEPHYLTVGPNDAHLFDFFVLPEFRGRGINPWLVRRVASALASEGREKAFLEAAEWNKPQLSSLKKTPFVIVGRARKTILFGKPVVKLVRENPS
jgi:ribosomal protein S18 acetylase RimI-like enzyme